MAFLCKMLAILKMHMLEDLGWIRELPRKHSFGDLMPSGLRSLSECKRDLFSMCDRLGR